MAHDMTADDIRIMITDKLQPLLDKLNDVLFNTSKLYDSQREITNKLIKLEEAHIYTCKYQDQQIVLLNEKSEGMQIAIDKIRHELPDQNTVSKYENRRQETMKAISWVIGIIIFIGTIIGGGYSLYHNYELQKDKYNAVIRENEILKKLEAKPK